MQLREMRRSSQKSISRLRVDDMLWYRELGFSGNPLSIKPAAFDINVVGYDLEDVFDRIDRGQIIFIEGKYGYGKTTILKHLIARYGGKGELVYFNRNRADESISVEQLLKGGKGFLGRLFGGLPTDMILLLDEVEDLGQDDQKDILNFFSQGNFRAVVFFGPRFEDAKFNLELQKAMVNNVVQLVPLTDTEAVELVRERVGNLKLIPDKIIKLVFKHSDNNPRMLLENLEDLCKYAFDNNEEEITEEHVSELLGVKKTAKKKPSKRASKKKEAPKEKEKKLPEPPKVKSAERRHEAEDDIEVMPASEEEDIKEYPDEEDQEDVEYFYY
ncbi:hypothetical protein KY320_00090 [Candidatus Woesearchaeota archaeon]|nr:hypothetical protein [Candidatus Woesearchaeota archaeon]